MNTTLSKKSHFKNVIYIILLCFCIFITFLSIYYFHKHNHTYKFSSDVAKEYTKYLSSDELEGRLPGTEGNKKACDYVENHFKSLGLEQFDGSYENPFDMEYPKLLDFKPKFTITKDNNNLELIYGTDYMDNGSNYDINELTFISKDITESKEFSFVISKNNSLLQIIAHDPIDSRYSYCKDFKYDLSVSVSFEMFKKLKTDLNNGASAYIHIPFKPENATVNNIVGRIKGKDSSKSPVIFSCHLDHVGTDSLGNIYNGALDNASGTGFIMEFSKYVKSLGTPNRDILFVAFNGEDSGLLGSKAFADKYADKFKDSTVYNFDMIGGFNNNELRLVGSAGDTKNTEPIKSLSKIAEKQKAYFNYDFVPFSDHDPFRQHNIAAVTFCDNDDVRIHKPLDTIDFIDTKSIDRAFFIISEEINNKYYTKNIFSEYSLVFLIAGGLSSTLFIILIIKNNKKKVS
ncbi:M28 family metallopeptidase [Clostridium ihumii]|uniref:M28 family metallopeptidase n=1 Tax=Clostridium ihumii TaxID=1470356 RepID=UPI0006878C5D|nr:M28 family metallopeptidase [Clostridium ihumii]